MTLMVNGVSIREGGVGNGLVVVVVSREQVSTKGAGESGKEEGRKQSELREKERQTGEGWQSAWEGRNGGLQIFITVRRKQRWKGQQLVQRKEC